MNHKFPEYIKGEFISLRKVTVNDAGFIYELRTSAVAKFLNQPDGYSITSQREWIERRNGDEVNYIIHRNDTNERVGMCAIYECDWTNGVSNAGRLLLKEEYVNNGTPYGLESLKMIYGYVFDIMNFRKISGIINSKNEKIYSLQKYLGMKQEGYFEKHIMLRGEPQDMYFLSIFREEFISYCEKIDLLLNKFR